MQVSVEQINSVKKKLNFEIPAEMVSAETRKVFADLRKRIVIPGFRKGKAPEGLIRSQYQGQINSDVMKNLFNDCYFKYVQENNLYPVGYPKIDAEEFTADSSFKFSATIETYPEVSAEVYEGLQVEREIYASDEKAVEERLDQMRDNMSHLEPVTDDRGAQLKDHVVIDFVGYIDNEPLDGGSANDHALELGSSSFIPGFEDQVIGMKSGENRKIKLSFPENYHNSELSGKPVEFDVTLKEIKSKVLPELDDEFAKNFGEFENFADLKGKIAENVEKQGRDRIERDFRDRLVKQLIEKNDFEVPDSMVERQLDSMLESAKQRLQYQRMSLEMMGFTEESYKNQFRSLAAEQIKGALLLSEIARKEALEVSDADVDNKLRSISEESGQEYDRIRKYYSQNSEAKASLAEQLREEKVIEFIASKAVITDISSAGR